MYKEDKLRKYIENSVLKIENANFRIRLSKELSEKYEAGAYTNGIATLVDCMEQINKIGLQYPANANPIYYLYVVPDDNFIELLQYPHKTRTGGGRPVQSYDIDGFGYAYGVSQNMLTDSSNKNPDTSRIVNDIHELAHLVHSQFFDKNRLISEGFAETLPLYTMDYESKFDDHRNALKDLQLDQIYSTQELLDMEKNNTFDDKALLPNKSCSFNLSYISSYLFVRGCIETIASKFKLNRIEATQKFLEIVRSSQSINVWLIFDIANALGIPKNELLNKKKLQINTLNEIISTS